MILKLCVRDWIGTGTLTTCKKLNLVKFNASPNLPTSSSQSQETRIRNLTSQTTHQLQMDQLLKVLSHRQTLMVIMAYKLRTSSGNAAKAISILLNSAWSFRRWLIWFKQRQSRSNSLMIVCRHQMISTKL